MTFSVLLVTDRERRVVGTLWADDESKAKTLAPMLYGCDGDSVQICRTDDREIPLRLATPEPIHFC
jgi:hypothetical protein